MRTSTITVALTLVLVAAACNSQGSQSFEKKAVTRTVTGTEMKVKDLVGSGIVCAYDDLLLLREARDTSILVIYRVEGDSLVYVNGLINKGRGPREVIYTDFSLSGDSLFVSNSDPTGIKAIYGLPMKDIEHMDDPKLWKEYAYEERNLQTGLSFAKLDDGVFIFSGGTPNTKQILSIADFNRNTRTPLDFWPADSTQGPLHSKQMVYMQSYLQSQKGHLLYSNRYAWYMFIAKERGGKLDIEHMIYPRLPKYKIKSDENIGYTIDGELGIQPYTTQKYIYATLGKTRKELMDNNSYKGFPVTYVDEVEVYDWNGQFIDNYQTDVPFFSFAVSSDNKYLYTISVNSDLRETTILRYELSLR